VMKYNRRLKERARRLRTQMTDSERALWERLRRKQVHSVQFYRQKPIGNYIVDFYGPKGMPSSRPRICGCSASTISKC
jgi:very-short-patch-repair endonuclease